MSSPLSVVPLKCARCGADVAADALACPACHTLVHATELENLAKTARQYIQDGEPQKAREAWDRALNLLPPDSNQAGWIRGELARLAPRPSAAQHPTWARRFGPLAPLLVFLAKGKFLITLLKLKSLLSLGAFVALYWALYGVWFGVGFAVLVLVHELGHFVEIRRRGMPAELPMFVPGLGAYVRWTPTGVSSETRAYISLAGPMAGCIGSAVCAILWRSTANSLWLGLTSFSAMVNVLNLIPIWRLDGGQAIGALGRNERWLLAALAAVLAAALSQPLLYLVAAAACYQAFSRLLPAVPSRNATLYYLIVLAALTYFLQLAPLPVRGS